MSKHTPGPWKVLNSKKEEWYGRPLDYWTVTSKEGGLWICASPEWDPEYDDESTANARLIASAPELLEGAEALVESIEKLIAAGELSDRALEVMLLQPITHAIAKARGGA